ncbi:MAG: murein biosynthesis integral membrane protein MurJ [Actinomycetota bacterium]|nr:murein biosynthesis integral membrane protein MurJ [Actinomycetota bacterium]
MSTRERAGGRTPSLVGATSAMALGTLVSRLSGFASKVLLAWVVGFGVLNDSYTVANTLPNIVYELLLGGVLTSVVVPLLVRAARDDADGGLEYTQRLVTVATAVLVAATVVAVAAAPQLTRLYLGDGDAANPQLATAFAYLLLPEIVFYGLGALFGAILNARNVFAPPAWAPVVNNLVVLATLAVFTLVPGEISLDPVRMGETKLLVLGIGTTLGIAAQAAVLLPALRRIGFRFRWQWGWAELFKKDGRLAQAGMLVLWVVGYVLVSQVGYIATTRAAAQGAAGGVAIYSYAWMLFQLPYGVLGVSLLTAIMPRMSRAAAEDDTTGIVDNLSLGSRYSAVLLVPVAVLLTVAGQSIGIALFSFGAAGSADAKRLGLALACSAFGLLPYAVTMLQLRVYYAMADARTPTLIILIMTVVKVPLLLACPAVLDPEDVVLGLAAVNAAGFVLSAVVGQIWLRVRLGRVRTAEVLMTVGKTILAAVPAAGVALSVGSLIEIDGVVGAWVHLVVSTLLIGVVMTGTLLALRTGEMLVVVRGLLSRFSHRS